MSNVNIAIVIGRTGRDPECRYLPSGDPVVNFSLATSEKWTDKSGVKQERTEWHNVVAFGPQAKFVRDYVGKGDLLYVEGSLQTDTYKDRDGNERKTTKIKARKVNSLTPKGSRSEAPREDHEPVLDVDQDDVPFAWLLPVMLPLLSLSAVFA